MVISITSAREVDTCDLPHAKLIFRNTSKTAIRQRAAALMQ